MADNNWITIYTTPHPHLAALIKSFLAENGINTVEINKKSSPHLIGEIEIYVRREEVIKAKYFIEKNIK